MRHGTRPVVNPGETLTACYAGKGVATALGGRSRSALGAMGGEDDRMAENLDRLLKQTYEKLGYPIVYVPVLSIKQRVDFILERLK